MLATSYATWASGIIVLALCSLLAYVLAARQQTSWNHWRTASFACGILLLLLALLPRMVAFAHHDLRGHMLQHLLLGMLAPLGLVFAAPISLLLRSVEPAAARAIVSMLHSRWVRMLSHPVVALFLNVGGMYLLYATPLYAATQESAVLHVWVHLHFIAAGCLFTWSIVGPDPAPRRPSLRYRFIVLFLAIASHTILAKLMYAYGWPAGGSHSAEEARAAAKIMYYGGDLTELLLIAALMACWYKGQRRRGHRLASQS